MKPRIIFDKEVFRKIQFWVDISPIEISGLGNVVYDKELQAFKVVSAILLPQKNSAATTDIEANDICKALYDMRDAEGELRFWFHSHVNMGVFWSGTDTSTIASIAEGGYVVASVFNKKGEVKSAFSSSDYHFPLFIDDLPYEIDGDKQINEAWKKEYEEKCTQKVFVPCSTYIGNTLVLSKAERKALRKQNKQCEFNQLVIFTDTERKAMFQYGVNAYEIDTLENSGLSRAEILNELNLIEQDLSCPWEMDY